MNHKTKEFRERIADYFIKSLEEKALDWNRPWKAVGITPVNAATNRPYNGLNKIWLMLLGNTKEVHDPRWATFQQIKSNHWHLKAGSKGTNVEYWMPYDFQKKKAISWDEYKKLPPDQQKKTGITARYFTVFHASDIEGLPPLLRPNTQVETDSLIRKLSENMNVPILDDGMDRAYYRPAEDKIHTPKKVFFKNSDAYNAVCLHELAHATGAAHRLNRNITNIFGSESYAYEELIAEITSSFMSADLQLEGNDLCLENHKAYIQSWITGLKEKPSSLIAAIKEASKASDYMEYKAGLISEQEYGKRSANESLAASHQASASIQQEAAQNGYTVTSALATQINALAKSTAGIHSLNDIALAFKNQNYPDETGQKAVNSIGRELARQEKGQIMLSENHFSERILP